jgi:hypothetical protein
MPNGTDHDFGFADRWHEREERAGMRGEYSEKEEKATASARFRFITDGELENEPLPDFIIDKTLVAKSLAMLVGEPGTYKSFIALAFAMCIKAGVPFAGRAVTQGSVVYVLAEGRGMFSLRTRAWKQHNDILGDLGVFLLTHPVQLADRGEVESLIQAILALPERPALVIIDTLARSAVGLNENSAEHMGAVIAGADRIREATGAAVLLLHHTPRGEERERGSTALRGATDTLLLATVDGDFITLSVKRQKDVEEATPLVLRRRVLILPSGRSSVVLVPVSEAEERRIPSGLLELPASQRALLEAIYRAGGRSNKQLMQTAELDERKFFRALKGLRGRGLVELKKTTLSVAGRALVDPECVNDSRSYEED